MDLGEIKIRIGADMSSLATGIQQAQTKIGSMGSKLQSVGAGMAKVGAGMSVALTAPIVMFAKMGMDELADIQTANAQTASVIAKVGAAAGVTANDVTGMAGELQKLSGFDDQAIQDAANTLLTMGAGGGPEGLRAATTAAADLAARFKMDVGPAAKMVGKALADPENASKRLLKQLGYGKADIEGFSKQLAGIKDPAQRQAMLLDLVEKKVGGAAAAYGKTFPAQLAVAKDALAGVAATVVSFAIPYIQKFATIVQDLAARFQALSPQTQKVVGVILLLTAVAGPLLIVMGALVGAAGTVMTAIAAISLPVVAVVAAIALLVGAFIYAWRNSEAFRDGVKAAWEDVKVGIMQVIDSLRETIGQWVEWAKALWKRYGDEITTVARTAWSAISSVIGTYLTVIKSVVVAVLAVLRGDWSTAWNAIKDGAAAVWGLIKTALTKAWEGIKEAASLAASGVLNAIVGKIDDTTGKVKAVWTAIGSGIATAWASIKETAAQKAGEVVSSITGAFSGLAGKLEDIGSAAGGKLASALKSAVNAVLDKIRGISLPSVEVAGKRIGGGSPFSGIPRLARGGLVNSATLAVIGEAGPEAVVPLGRGGQASRDRARVLGEAGLGGSGVTVNQYFTGADPDMFAASRSARFAFQTAGMVSR